MSEEIMPEVKGVSLKALKNKAARLREKVCFGSSFSNRREAFKKYKFVKAEIDRRTKS